MTHSDSNSRDIADSIRAQRARQRRDSDDASPFSAWPWNRWEQRARQRHDGDDHE